MLRSQHIVRLAVFPCAAQARFRKHQGGASALNDEHLLLRDAQSVRKVLSDGNERLAERRLAGDPASRFDNKGRILGIEGHQRVKIFGVDGSVSTGNDIHELVVRHGDVGERC